MKTTVGFIFCPLDFSCMGSRSNAPHPSHSTLSQPGPKFPPRSIAPQSRRHIFFEPSSVSLKLSLLQNSYQNSHWSLTYPQSLSFHSFTHFHPYSHSFIKSFLRRFWYAPKTSLPVAQ